MKEHQITLTGEVAKRPKEVCHAVAVLLRANADLIEEGELPFSFCMEVSAEEGIMFVVATDHSELTAMLNALPKKDGQ